MSVFAILAKYLGPALAKVLLKRYIGEPGAAAAGGVLDIIKDKLPVDEPQQKRAERLFTDYSEQIITNLVPLFHGSDVNVDAIAGELGQAFEGKIDAQFFVERDLNPQSVEKALLKAHPPGGLSQAEDALYRRALSHTVRYLIGVANEFPAFQKEVAAQSLQRLGRLAEDMAIVLERTARIESRLADTASEEDRFVADYLQAVERNLNYLELFGADLPPEARRQTLSVAYVSLNIATDDESVRNLPFSMVLGDMPPGGRLLVFGDAGAGKSTLFRWAARGCALGYQSQDQLLDRFYRDIEAQGGKVPSRHRTTREVFEEFMDPGKVSPTTVPWQLRIPFLIRLRDCKDGRLPPLDDYPQQISDAIGTPPNDWVLKVLKVGMGLVLIDGVDEVPTKHREKVWIGLQDIIKNSPPGNIFLVSSRPAAVPDGWLASLGFREAHINPMSETDRSGFIRKWHEAVGYELIRSEKPTSQLEEQAETLIEKLRDNSPIAFLATNPLLCAMICALHRDRHGKLPQSQNALCEDLCVMLLVRREQESGLADTVASVPYRELDYSQRRAIVQDLAYYLVENNEISLSEKRAVEQVEGSLRLLGGPRTEDARDILDALIERSGILRRARTDHVEFIHNTFKDFLAAERFVDIRHVGRLAGQIFEERWQPVILFALGTSRNREFATQLTEKIMQGRGGDRFAREFFLIRCRSFALLLEPDVSAKIEVIQQDFLPPGDMRQAAILAATGGDAIVPFLRYNRETSAASAAACVRALRLIGTENARQALRSCLGEGRETVLSELVQAINPLEIEVYKEQVIHGKRLPDEVRAQISNLTPLQNLTNLLFLDLSRTQVSDVTPLQKLTNLRTLDLSGTQVSDVALLQNLTNLLFLDLSRTQVSDVTPLQKLTNLRTLDLSGTQVSDVTPLQKLTNLQSLELGNTQVSDVTRLCNLTNLKSLAVNSSNTKVLRGIVEAVMYIDA